MVSNLLKQVRNLHHLEAAWRSVRSNGLASKSDVVRKDIQKFEEDPTRNLRSLQSRLVRGSFKFSPARGVPIPKPGRNDIRPIVLADVETRIVQRAILDVLQNIDELKPFFLNPNSFGGIKKRQDQPVSAVPAAIKAVLDAIGAGARHIVCADISAFFTRIQKSTVSDIVSSAVDDEEFMDLFRRAIHVELSNLTELREKAHRFPTEDLGVAQGSALSPLLGNIILADFDKQMNEGDCRCIRYIDDFVVLGPSAAAVMARVRLAKGILGALGMSFALDKTSPNAIPVTVGFEFLGIEINNGLIRPSSKARTKFLTSLRTTFNQGRDALNGYRNGQPLPKSNALLGTLKKVDGIIQGWGKHYHFCNDKRCFENLDQEISKLIRDHLAFYSGEHRKAPADRKAALLGVEMLSALERTPFEWPKVNAACPSHAAAEESRRTASATLGERSRKAANLR
ncbi:reverse transcriptase domain-containing protein [Rhodomicrobium lacus]|uniref:reverse transcriptase domain-containing protein n=1 Tax=Rhodomicrobium lacus TaxID=2498452 RepID=UPI0026E40C79|nr:reverse transcriptase domain-containing protein [Rhodomicrobium lacus]WKW49902.1 reverse transcriptase domain-containing protein [Rhodomicrobium lacus]